MLDLDGVSRLCGFASVGIWFVALVPQVILNFRRRSASGLAPLLLLLWLTADTAGMAGAFATNQLPFQKVIACWHWLVDAVLTAQWIWYRKADALRIQIEDRREAEIRREEMYRRHRKLSIDQALALHDDSITPMHLSRQRPSFSGPRGPLLPPLLARTKSERRVEKRRGRRTLSYLAGLSVLVLFGIVFWLVATRTRLLDHTLPHGKSKRTRLLGQVAAWFCAILYLVSRIPQLWHNASRKSVHGLSISLFVLGLFANAFYTTSILLSRHATDADGHWDGKYIVRAAPYLVTALGASALDTGILGQYFFFRGWQQPDPRDRLEPGLARREALVAAGADVFEESAEVSRTGSISEAPNERTALLSSV